jgi:protein-L-isoaspartate(D-aspartate) O-methyltransferase
MFDFAAARRMMVDGQVRTSDVTDQRIIAAMLDVPREQFVPAQNAALAYLDLDVAVTATQPVRRLLKPMVLAKLIQAAEIGPRDRVLDVGCATGYSTALLARLAQHVVALEQDPDLARAARQNLATLAASVEVVTGALPDGWRAGAPYDVILLNGAAEVVPERLLAQLADGGRLVGVVGRGPATKAVRYLAASGTKVSPVPIFDAAAPALPGFTEALAFVF